MDQETARVISESNALVELEKSAGWRILSAKLDEYVQNALDKIENAEPEDTNLTTYAREYRVRKELRDILKQYIETTKQNAKEITQESE